MTGSKKKDVNAGLLYLIGNMSTKAVAFLTVPIFTRLLTAAEYGVVSTYTSWVQIASVIVTLSLYNSFRIAYVEKGKEFGSYCASVLRLGGILSLAWGMAAVLLSLLVMRDIAWMVPCCIIQAYGTFCVTAMSTRYMLEFRYRKRTAYMVIPNAACALLAVFLLATHEKDRVFWRITAYATVYAVFILFTLWTTRKDRTDTGYWHYAVRYSLPLVFHGLSLVVLSSSDRIMITHFAGAQESGIYSLAYNIGLVSLAVISSVEGVWVPWFIRKLKEEKIEDINCRAKSLIEMVSVIVTGIMLTAPEILQVMAPEKYWGGKPVIYPIVAAAYIMFLYDLAVNVEYQTKKTKMIALNTCMAALANILLNLLFIPRFGAVAAAYTTVAAYLLSWAFHYHCARKSCPGIFPASVYGRSAAAVAAASVAGNFIYGERYAAARWASAAAIGIIYISRRLWAKAAGRRG